MCGTTILFWVVKDNKIKISYNYTLWFYLFFVHDVVFFIFDDERSKEDAKQLSCGSLF